MKTKHRISTLQDNTRATFGLQDKPKVSANNSQASRTSTHSSDKNSVRMHSAGLVDMLKPQDFRKPTHQSANVRLAKLLDEAVKVMHLPQDMSRLPHIMDETSMTSRDRSAASTLSIQEVKSKVENFERAHYLESLNMCLIALLEGLGVPQPATILASKPTMEDLAREVKKIFQTGITTVATVSSRTIRKEEADPEVVRENKRLKELVVKLQYEINENFKKCADTRMRELYEENQNFQRKIADLIDQLKRKEQEILLIPLGKVAQTRIDSIEAEKNALQRELAQLKVELERTRKKQTPFMPQASGVFLDPYLVQTLGEQRVLIEELSALLTTVRGERDSLEASVVALAREKNEYERTTVLFDNYLHSQGVDTAALLSSLDGPIQNEPLDPIEALKELKAQLSRVKAESQRPLLNY